MRLEEFLKKEYIIPELITREKTEVIAEISGYLADQTPELDRKKIYKSLLDREYLGTTGIGSGIAIPHARMDHVSNHILCFARSERGVFFESVDSKVVQLIFILIAPSSANEVHLKMLARVSKFLHDTSFREQLLMAKNVEEIFLTIIKKDEQY